MGKKIEYEKKKWVGKLYMLCLHRFKMKAAFIFFYLKYCREREKDALIYPLLHEHTHTEEHESLFGVLSSKVSLLQNRAKLSGLDRSPRTTLRLGCLHTDQRSHCPVFL